MKLNNILILVIILLVLKLFYFDNMESYPVENFADFYSECSLGNIMENIAKKYSMKNNEDNYDYYFPCEYNTCEERVKEFESHDTKRKIFLIDGCDWPASKIHLWILLKSYYGNEKASQLMPQTFLLDEKKDLESIKTHFDENLKIRKDHMYILKNYAQRQEGLKIVNKYKDIMEGYKNGFYLVQDYLYNPFLISRRKINFRYYTLIVCRNGNVEGYIHKDGFVYYTPEDYDASDPSFDKHITTGYIDRSIYEKNPLTLDDFRNYLENIEKGKALEWDNNVNVLMHQIIKAISTKVCKNKKLKHHTLFQLFGSDVAPTADLSAFLMEINKGPDLEAKDKRDKKVKSQVQEDIIKLIEVKDKNGNVYKDNRFVKVF
jgi:hypothetical protein